MKILLNLSVLFKVTFAVVCLSGVITAFAQDMTTSQNIATMQDFVYALNSGAIDEEGAYQYISGWSESDIQQFILLDAQYRGLGNLVQGVNAERSSSSLALSSAAHIFKTNNSAGTAGTQYYVKNDHCDGDSSDAEFLFAYNVLPNNISNMKWYSSNWHMGIRLQIVYRGGLLAVPLAAGTKTGLCLGDNGVNFAGGASFVNDHLKLKPS